MKILSLISILFLLLYAFSGAPGLFADDDDGGSAFDEPGAEEEAPPDEPKPATYSFKDYRIIMKTEDGRWWKQNKNYTEEQEKAHVLLKLEFKLPKSESPFDVYVQVQGFAHNLKLTFKDGSSVGAANYKVLCSKHFEGDKKYYEGAKDIDKPKKVPLGKKRWKAYRYAVTGQPGGNMARRKTAYYWKYKDKTYMMVIIMNTTAAKNKRITKEVASLLKSLEPKPERR